VVCEIVAAEERVLREEDEAEDHFLARSKCVGEVLPIFKF